MWHIIILLPIVGIAVFWLLPLSLAIPIYILILALSGLMYWTLYLAMRKHPKGGKEELIGANARVVSVHGAEEKDQYTVEAQGGLWGANSPDRLEKGEVVRIVSLDGLTVTVRRTGSEVGGSL